MLSRWPPSSSTRCVSRHFFFCRTTTRARTPSACPPRAHAICMPAEHSPNWRAVRDDGWIIRCEIGTNAARDAGGTGRLATRTDASACASVDAAVAFDAETGYEPPQGSVRLLVPSRLLSEGRSFWKLEEVDERGVPKFVKWRVECPAGIQACPASTSAHGHPTPRPRRARTHGQRPAQPPASPRCDVRRRAVTSSCLQGPSTSTPSARAAATAPLRSGCMTG